MTETHWKYTGYQGIKSLKGMKGQTDLQKKRQSRWWVEKIIMRVWLNRKIIEIIEKMRSSIQDKWASSRENLSGAFDQVRLKAVLLIY